MKIELVINETNRFMKYLSLSLIIILNLSCNTLFCQSRYGDEQVIQFSNGKNEITLNIIDFETNYPLIGAEVFSFELKKTLDATDISGVATIEKGLKGNLQVSYVGYDKVCFRLKDTSIDSLIVRLKANIDIGCRFLGYDIDSIALVHQAAKQLAHNKISKGEIYLFYIDKPTEEQQIYAKDHSFTLKEWNGKYPEYKQSFNEIVINYLSEKFNINIREELRELCWKF